MSRARCHLAAGLLTCAVALVARADDAASQPAASRASRPTTTQASQPLVNVSPAAEARLRKAKAALDAAGNFTVAGKLKARFDVAGRQATHEAEVRTAFAPDGRFRHELVGIGIVVGDAQSVTFYDQRRNAFGKSDQPLKIGPAADVIAPVVDVLRDENPLLLLVLSTQPHLLLGRGALEIDASSDGSTIEVKHADETQTLTFDEKTNQLRRVAIDLTPRFKQRGATATAASAEITYDAVASVAPFPDDAFSFIPPASATEFALDVETPTRDLVQGGPATQPVSDDQ